MMLDGSVRVMVPASVTLEGDLPLLGEHGGWRVYASDSPLQDAIRGDGVMRRTTATSPTVAVREMGATTNPDGRVILTTEAALTFSAVSLTPSLFRRGASIVAIYAPDDADARDVAAIARHEFGDVQSIARA
jgi:hypothetical protein